MKTQYRGHTITQEPIKDGFLITVVGPDFNLQRLSYEGVNATIYASIDRAIQATDRNIGYGKGVYSSAAAMVRGAM